MAGHSKWANIKHRKGREDAKRGKLFSKLIREITVAARIGGKDAAANPRLRAAVDNALSNNMTKDTIERAVQRGAGNDADSNVDEIRYEGYGPGGVAVLVDTMTDNKNRTVAVVRHAFSKYAGKLGTDGSVSYMFTKVGLISFSASVDEDTIIAIALEADADDVVTHDDGSIDIIIEPDLLVDLKEVLVAAGHQPDSAEITMRADNTRLLDFKDADSMIRLIDTLEDLDDVQRVYSNAKIPDNILAKLE